MSETNLSNRGQEAMNKFTESKSRKKQVNSVFITSTDVVLLDTRDACMIIKQRRLRAKAKFRTASRYTICKKHGNNEKVETKHGNGKRKKKCSIQAKHLPKAKKIIARLPGELE